MKVLNYRAVNKGMLLGSFSLLLKSGQIIYKCTLVETRDGGQFVNMPSEKQTNNEGQTKYYPYIGFETNELRKIFTDEALLAVKEYLRLNPEAKYGGKKNEYQAPAQQDPWE